jgi:amino acid transporter/nucleotide-binding universal stress UspA family protein
VEASNNQNNNNNNNNIETELSRDLGLTSALAIGIGTMIAAGIFTLSGLAIRNVGSAAIVSFLLAAIVATFTALTYCEFVSIYPRTGEGYLYARKTFSPPIAYFVGWALFLGYASSCAFYIASLSSYFNEFIWHSPIESFFGILMLIGLTLLNIKGTKESGKFQIWVTGAKVILLIWFIFGGMSFVEIDQVMDRFNSDIVKIGSTAALVFITFFGFSAIAASAGEVKDPVKNIPRAIFISMGVVTLLYTLVVLVVLFAGLEEYTEASMGEAAKKFLGYIGGYVIIAGAIFSMISASNASIMAGSRVLLSMSQLGHMPKEIGIINTRTRTPIMAVLLVGGGIMLFALALPLEDLSYFANTVLLLALILVNIALIVHRRKYPDIERPFKVPLVPLLPILGILANLYLIAQIFQHPIPLVLAIGSLLIGVLGFVAWKGSQAEQKAIPGLDSHIAHSQGKGTLDKDKFRILVPISNPYNYENLIKLAIDIAKARNGEIWLLRVVTIPEQLPPTSFDESIIEKEGPMLKKARKIAEAEGINTHALIRVGHHVARAILETSKERFCNLILLGWKGYSSNQEKILGTITDDVVRLARTDIILAKIVGDQPIKKILLPTAGGEHAQCAESYATSIVASNHGEITVCQVVTPASDETISRQNLDQAIERLGSISDIKLSTTLIKDKTVTEGIIHEAEDYDAVMVGAAGKSIYPQIMLGNIPEEIARKTEKSVIVVKHYHPVKALLGRVVGE